MVVLVNAYTGVLTSLLAVPKWEPIVQTLDDVAASPHLRLTVEKATVPAQEYLVMASFPLKNLLSLL